MADDSRSGRAAPPAREDLVAAYKRLLQVYLDRRPSGMRLKIAKAIGKHRSFVSQITNPAYPIPVPARHLERIFKICHFSPEEKQKLMAAYAAAHPNQSKSAAPPRRAGTRVIEVELPVSGNAEVDREIEDAVRGLARQLGRIARRL